MRKSLIPFKDEIVKDYRNNLSSGQIAKKYDFKIESVQALLKREIGLKSASQSKIKYRIRQDIFNSIDEHWKAYFLGWLYSDGNVYTGAGKFSISLCITESDKYILEYFSRKIYIDYKNLNYRRARFKKGTAYLCKPLYRLQIDNKDLVIKLLNYGLIQNKSKIIRFPDFIPREFLGSFMQGLFEGDGSITKNSKSLKSKNILFFTGSDNFANDLASYLESINIFPSIYRNNSSLNIVRFGKKKEVETFKNLIYKNAEIKLTRKYDKFNIE